MRKNNYFQTTIDSGVLLSGSQRACDRRSVREAVAKAMQYIKGAYSLLVGQEKVACQRSFWLQAALSGAEELGCYVVASETCALDTVGAEFIRDLEPGDYPSH